MIFNRNKKKNEQIEKGLIDLNNDIVKVNNQIETTNKNLNDYITKTDKRISFKNKQHTHEIDELRAKINNLQEQLDIQTDTITILQNNLTTYSKLENIVRKQTNIIQTLNDEINQLKPQQTQKDEIKQLTPSEEVIIKYENNPKYTTPYDENNVRFDGFNIIYIKGGRTGKIAFNVLNLIHLQKNLHELTGIILTGQSLKEVYKEYGIGLHTFQKVIYNILNGNEFLADCMDSICKPHLYELYDGLIYIDNENTNLKIDELNYIKTCIENSNNKYETINNLIGFYKNINPKHITIISLNISKLPSRWLEQPARVRNENDTAGRFKA